MNDGLNVLIVEDEAPLACALEQMVTYFGAGKVWICGDDTCAFDTAMREAVDVVFMDLNIRGSTDGIRCARRITAHKEVSIVFATSFCDGEILEEAIDVNTLNYLVKPYGKKDVEITMNLARVARDRRRRSPSAPLSFLRLEGGLTFDASARTLYRGETPVALTKKEFDLLALLLASVNKAVTTDTILTKVWEHRTIAPSTLRETVTRLRKKLPELRIRAVHGAGYRLDGTPEQPRLL